MSVLDFFKQEAKGSSLLHVGCVEHDESYINNIRWKHRKLHDVAARCVGLDINSAGIDFMRELGFNVVCADVTCCEPLTEIFDLIIVGDVIEHLGNPEALMNFCRQNISLDGRILISTPNPFYVGHVFRAWTNSVAPTNLEHSSWITEFNILELARRSNLELAEIYYPCGESSRSKFKRMLKKIAFQCKSSMLTTTVIYVLKQYVPNDREHKK